MHFFLCVEPHSAPPMYTLKTKHTTQDLSNALDQILHPIQATQSANLLSALSQDVVDPFTRVNRMCSRATP